METLVNAKNLSTVEQLRGFLEGTQPVAFEVPGGKGQRSSAISCRAVSDSLTLSVIQQ